eukprot:229514-Chlamydomonas_euryale.AAC.1
MVLARRRHVVWGGVAAKGGGRRGALRVGWLGGGGQTLVGWVEEGRMEADGWLRGLWAATDVCKDVGGGAERLDALEGEIGA